MRIALTLLMGIMLTTAGFAQSDAQQKINKGKDYLKIKDYANAAQSYEAALSIEPTNTDALSGIIVAYAYQNKLKDAQNTVEKALKSAPNSPEIMVLKGKCLGLRNQFYDAIDIFKNALNYASDTLKSTIYTNISTMENQLNKLEDALLDAQKAISYNDKNIDAYNTLGFTQYSLKNYNEAIDSYSYAITIDPENAVTYYNRGMAYFKINDRINSCADFQRACKRGNKNACVQYGTECRK